MWAARRSWPRCARVCVVPDAPATILFIGDVVGGLGRRALLGLLPGLREELTPDAVVVNADFGHAMTTLVPGRLRRRWTDATIARKRFSCSTFMLYLGIEGRYDQLLHHNIYMARDYRRNLDEIENQHVPSAAGQRIGHVKQCHA